MAVFELYQPDKILGTSDRIMLDVGYFLRTVLLGIRYKGRKQDGDLFDDYVVNGQCSLSDLDLNWHMNNSRYLRECDFGRFVLLFETGLWKAVMNRRTSGMKDANLVASAFQVQYRQSLVRGDRFQIVTRLHGWDDRAFYFEQVMVREKDQRVAFSLLMRMALTPRDLTPQMLIDDLKRGVIQSPVLAANVQNFVDHYKLNLRSIKSKL
jgi:acyl-CoA thioesterase FadM